MRIECEVCGTGIKVSFKVWLFNKFERAQWLHTTCYFDDLELNA